MKISNSEETTITVLENTELELVELLSSENTFSIKKGGISFNTQNSSIEYFLSDGINYIFKNSFSSIETNNSQFTFKYKSSKSFFLDVKYGLLKLTNFNNGTISYCIGGYVIDYSVSSVITVPYYKLSSDRFVEAVKQISKFPNDDIAFNYIIKNSTEDDILTLWHLFTISNAHKRKLLIDAFDELLLLDLKDDTKNGINTTLETKQELLEFITNTLIMRN